MQKNVKVFKFGGAALKDAAAIRQVKKILDRFADERLLIVVSAIGKTTDALERVVEAHAGKTAEALSLLESIKRQHYELLAELVGEESDAFALVNDLFVEIDWMLEEAPHDDYDYMYDQIVGVGELVSSRIVGAFLSRSGLPTRWLDARDVILTDNIYREGWVQWKETCERARGVVDPGQEGFIITQGFIGSTTENFTTTLGRAGSDYSAAIFAHCLDADSMTIWKDVPGMLTADPRFFKNAIKLDKLSYRETIEMTYYGASVIHLKTIKPLQKKGIPLYVKSFLHPEEPGTVISGDVEINYPPMIAVERDQAFLQIATRDYSFVAEQHFSYLFNLIAEMRIQVNLMQNSAISFNLCVNDLNEKVDRFVKRIEEDYEVDVDRGLELITVRHDQPEVLDDLRRGKEIIYEKRIPHTVQMVVRSRKVD